MSRETEDEIAATMVAELKHRGFRICENVPKADASYLEGGSDAKEWSPLDDKQARKVAAYVYLLAVGAKP